MKNNRATARRIVKSAVEARALVKQDQQVAFRAITVRYVMTDAEKQKPVYREMSKLEGKPYPAVNGIKKVMEIYDSPEMRKHKPVYFCDASSVRELDQNGFIDNLYK